MINIQFKNFNNQFNTRVKRTPTYLLPIILGLVCLFIFGKLYSGYQGDFRPQGIHFWAQADRYSISQNYYDNGLNFFEPQTNYLEFSDGKTGVEFPAVQYLAALIAKPFGAREQLFLIYRILCFMFLCAGMQFLMKTIKMHGGNAFQQILIPVFFMLSPVLLFYGFNLLPDIPSFSLILISYYYFEKFRLNLHFNSIYYALIWGCAAALLKLTSAIFPLAYMCWFLANAIFIEKQITRKQIIQVLSGFILFFGICVGINYYFTIRANAVYQSSVFLSMSRHINDWNNFSEIWEAVVCWHREYFRETQYWVILVAFIVSLDPRFSQKGVLGFKGILLLGFVCFILLMGKQLINHDYYAICTIVPVILMLSIDGLMILTRGCFGGLILLYLVQNLAPYSLNQSYKRQAEVYNIPCREIWDYRGYMIEGADWIKKNKIPKTEKVFVLYDYPLNTPLIYLDRTGMVLDHYKMKDRALVDRWFNLHKPRFLFIPKPWKQCLGEDQPDMAKRTELLYEGKEVLVYKYKWEIN
ncbi:MAG: hypothetical protein ACKVQB_06900 [Bacteroidia bacterium]